MAEPFLSEIRITSFPFAPKGWALCNGQLLPINQNQALFSLLGTTYGGDGRVNFSLPNLQGRAPVHFGNGVALGESGGAATHTLTVAETAGHTHRMRATTDFTNTTVPGGALTAAKKRGGANIYGAAGSANVSMHAASIAPTAGPANAQPHENMAPFLTLNYIISLFGIFPSPN